MFSSTPNVKIVYRSSEMPELRSPYLICGLPGTGYIGKLTLDYMIHELNASHLVDIYSSSFPPKIVVRSNGIAELMKNTIFYSKAISSSNNDLLLLTGDSQPENPDSEYLLIEQILDIAAKFNTKKIFALAGYATGQFVDNPRIFGTATDIDMLDKFKERNIIPMDIGSIIGGMNGLIIGVAKLRGMHGTCILVETSGYVVDAKASKFILECLTSILGISIDMANLEKKAKETEILIQTIQQQIAREGLEYQQSSMPRKPANTGYIS
jgi:uncharacterized protein